MDEVPAFSGFPREGLQFLEDLARNKNREWFQAYKGDYQDYVLGPAQEFAFALGERLRTISKGIAYDTRTSGGGSILPREILTAQFKVRLEPVSADLLDQPRQVSLGLERPECQ